MAHDLCAKPAFLGAALLSLAVLVPGCAPPAAPPKDDEAMVRARCQGRWAADPTCRPLSPGDAARAWFPPSHIDYFKGMDRIVVSPEAVTDDDVNSLNVPVYQLLDGSMPAPAAALVDPKLTRGEIAGRNAWMAWCGGNEGFWDWLATEFGFVDLLKLIDTRQRTTRFRDAGLINEPGMRQAGAADDFGLWLDEPASPAARAWRRAYIRDAFGLGDNAAPTGPGYTSDAPPAAPTARGGYGQESPAASSYEDQYAGHLPPAVYGLASGVVGLRLFPNPRFDAEARRKWDATSYYANPRGDPTMERPFRVGMSCAFCHASYHPLEPPLDLASPEWRNISGTIGAQYLRIRAVFGNLLPEDNFIYHLLDSQPPGTIDTSLIASDNINNPNTMNAVFKLPQRALVSFLNPKEKQAAPSAKLPSLWRHPEANPAPGAEDVTPQRWREVFESVGLTDELQRSNGDPRRVPRILVDGADSIGGWGALARVYLNIGTHYEHWNQLHLPVVGFRKQEPFRLDTVAQHSVYWHATELRVPYMRDYFLKVTPAMPLVEARENGRPDPPDAQAAATETAARLARVDVTKLQRGRQVFARNCIVCHSSIQPANRWRTLQDEAAGGELWDHDPGRWLTDPEYAAWARGAVETPEFWRDNYLSTDFRVPVTLVETNACRALGTNAIAGNMWQDFASESYRHLPAVGAIRYFDPFGGPGGTEGWYTPQHKVADGVPAGGGGPGFYRVPTLVSIWATAPYLHNNSLGLFNNDPSVKGRLAAFDDGIRKLLWPERRLRSSSYNDATAARLRRDHGLIWRTPRETWLHINGEYVPGLLGMQAPVIRQLDARLPWIRRLPPKLWPLPSALLLVVAFLILVRASRFLTRLIGYAAIVAAFVAGGLVYLLNGGLGDVRIGPIPKGTPVNLLANVNPDADPARLTRTIRTTIETLTEIESTGVAPEDRWRVLGERVAPELVAVSKCPDFVMDRGHYFEWFEQMSDDDKHALIELLKTF